MGWLGWLFSIVVAGMMGFAASRYLRNTRLPRQQHDAGIASLADMRWRDFVNLVLEVLARRGYKRLPGNNVANADGDYLLERGGKRWLLSSRYGGSQTLGPHAMTAFANDLRMKGAAGGLLITPGSFSPDLAQLARMQDIQLLDGPTLWLELRELLTPAQREATATKTQKRNRQEVIIAWAASAIVGVTLISLLGGSSSPDTGAPQQAAVPEAPVPVPATPPAAVATESASTAAAVKAAPRQTPQSSVASSPMPDDPAQIEQRRTEAVRLIASLQQVDHAVWSTESTLLVFLQNERSDPMSELCPILEHYDELAASRVQLQPPTGSTRPVRFLQCRSF